MTSKQVGDFAGVEEEEELGPFTAAFSRHANEAANQILTENNFNPWEGVSPGFEVPSSKITEAMTIISTEAPFLARAMAQTDVPLILAPEILGTLVDDTLGSAGFATYASEQILSGLADADMNFGFTGGFAEARATLRDGEAVAAFFSENANTFTPQEKDFFAHLLMNVNFENRNEIAAQAIEFVRNNPLATPEDRQDFMVWFGQRAFAEQQGEAAEDSFIGRVGSFLAQPFEAVSEQISRLWAHAGKPEDFAHRQFLSPGQNLAISVGVDPAEGHYNMVSGTADLLLNLSPADPLNLFAGIGAGVKLARGTARAADLSRGRALVTSLRPFTRQVGGNDLPMFSRGTTARLTFSLMSRTLDQIVDSPRVSRAVDRMAEIDNVNRLVQEFPQLERVQETLGVMIAGTDDTGQIRDIIRYGMSPVGDENIISNTASARLVAAQDNLAAKTNELLDSEVISLSDLVGRVHNVTGEFAELADGTGRSVALTSNMRILDLGLGETDDGRRLIAWLGEGNGGTGVSAAAKIINGQTLNTAEDALVRQFLRATGADGVRIGDTVTLSARGLDKGYVGRNFDSGADAKTALRAEEFELTTARALYNAAESGKTAVNAIVDLPRQSRGVGARVRGALRRGPGGDSWLSNATRSLVDGFTSPALPKYIPFDDVNEGAAGMRTFLRRMGGTAEDVDKWVDQFVRAPAELRNQVLRDAMQEIGARTHPLMAHGLVTWSDKRGIFTYAKNADGEEIGLGVGRTAGEAPSALPIDPVHAAQGFSPPGEEFFEMFDRYRRTQVLPDFVVRGFLRKTRDARQNLANRYRRVVANRNPEAAFNLDDDTLMAMAYSDIYGVGGDTGAGAISRAASIAGRGWDKIQSVFSIFQLAGRPIAWFGRVFVEEQVRASFFDLASLARNPWSWAREVANGQAGVAIARHAKAVDVEVARILDGAFVGRDPQLAASMIEQVIPDFRNLAQSAGVSLESPTAMRQYAGHVLGQAMSSPRLGGFSGVNLTRRGLRLQKKNLNAQERLVRNGLLPDFSFLGDDTPADILNRTFVSQFLGEVGSSYPSHQFVPGQMTRQGIADYGRAYGGQVHNLMKSPVIRRFTLPRMLADATGNPAPAGSSVAAFTRTQSWRQMRNNAERIAAHRGLVGLTENELAEFYLDTLSSELVRSQLGGFWGDDMNEFARIAREWIGSDTFSVNVGDEAFTFSHKGDNYESFAQVGTELAQRADDLKLSILPREITGQFSQWVGQSGDEGILRQASNSIMHYFGEELSQSLSRRPAWVQAQRRWSNYLQSIGWDEDTARTLAAEKATEIVNNVFYNDRATPRMIREIGRVVPFFSATVEVMSTWAYKIPMANGPLGYAVMPRRVDRFMDSLVKVGVVEVEDQQDGGRQYTWVGSRELSSGNEVGDAISRATFEFFNAPVEVFSQLGRVRGLFGGEFAPFDTSGITGQDFRFSIGNPVDPNSSGLMAVTQLSVGLNPIASLMAGPVLDRMPFANDHQRVDSDGLTTISELADQVGVDVNEFINYNFDRISEEIGREAALRLIDRSISPSELILPAAHWEIPKSSLVETLIDETFFPFGRVDTVKGAIWGFTPSWFNYALGGFAVRSGADETFVNALTPPVTEYQMGAEVADALRYLEVNESAISDATALRQAAYELRDRLLEEGVVEELEGGEINTLDTSNPLVAELSVLLEEATLAEEELFRRANNIAAGNLLLRGVNGFLSPVSPRQQEVVEEQQATFWDSREMVEFVEENGGSAFYAQDLDARRINRIRSGDDIALLNGLIGSFLEDPTTSTAKAFVLSQYPSLLPHLTPNTYWAGTGLPAAQSSLDKWWEDVQNGDREVPPPEVTVQLIARAGIDAMHEINVRQRFGSNPELAAQAILSNYGEYKQLNEARQAELDSLDWFDEYVSDGTYLEWRERNADSPSVHQLITSEISQIRDGVDDVVGFIDPTNLSRDDLKTVNRILGETARNLRDLQFSEQEMRGESAVQPRDAILSEYFATHTADYYEGLNELYSGLETATTDEERSAIYEDVRVYQNQHYLSPGPVINGVVMPNEMDRYWNSLDSEEQEIRVQRAIIQPPQWQNQMMINRMIEQAPVLAQYVPSSLQEMEVYDLASRAKREIDIQARTIGSDGLPVLTQSEARQAKSDVDTWMESVITEQGRQAELLYQEAWPIQRMWLAGMLPPQLDQHAMQVNEIRKHLDSIDKGPTSEAGRAIFLQFYNQVLQQGAQNPTILEEYKRLGDVLYDEDALDTIVGKFWYGAFIGGLG